MLVEVVGTMDLSARVTWVAGELSARSLATTRLAETWIHTGDVADALGVSLVPTDRLRQIARLAWRTLALRLCLRWSHDGRTGGVPTGRLRTVSRGTSCPTSRP